MALEKIAQNSAFKETRGVTGGKDKQIFKALSKAKVSKKKIAQEVLWFFGACIIAFLVAFLIFYLIGEFVTAVFIDFINDYGTITKFYFLIFLLSIIGVYVARLIVWAIKTVVAKN